jgi:anti-sigma B factor antagonist
LLLAYGVWKKKSSAIFVPIGFTRRSWRQDVRFEIARQERINVTITEQRSGAVIVLKLKGSFMGEPEASLFHKKKFQLIESKQVQIVLDCSELTMINSSGLGSLISALVSLRATGGDLRFANLSQTINFVIQKVQLDKVFRIFETVEEAALSFENQP